MSHAGFLREHWTGEDEGCKAYVQRLWALGQDVAALPMAEGLAHVHQGIEALAAEVGLDDQDVAQLRHVARVTLAPRSCRAKHVEELRVAGFDDLAIHDLVNIVACFAYMNRLVDGLGVTLQPHNHGLARMLLGDAALQRHLALGGGASD